MKKLKNYWDVHNDLYKLQNLHAETIEQLDTLKNENETLKTTNHKNSPEKRFCIHCGGKITSEFGFCPGCGKDLTNVKKCQACFVIVSSEEKFCPNCGHELKTKSMNN
jgi:rRNA maturation endonuclease Nob1